MTTLLAVLPGPALTWQGVSSPRTIARWLLAWAVALYTAGVAAALFTRGGSALGDVALMEMGFAHQQILLAERSAGALMLVAGFSLLWWPTTVALLFIGGMGLAEAWASYRFGGFAFYQWTFAANALRYGTPLALIPLVIGLGGSMQQRWRLVTTSWLLRIAIAVVFCTHGLEALYQHPGFIDLLILTAYKLPGWELREATVGMLLRVIGVVDLVVALLVLVGRWRVLLIWLACWGLITAMSRVTAWGFGSYPELLERMPHALAPLAVWALAAAEGRGSNATASSHQK